MVHHGLWDYDNPAAPNLVTITVNGRRIDAVAQVTKQGFTYVFDRVTGEPVWPIVERPVPTDSDVPGEKPYPTQPFPSKPPGLRRSGRLARRCQRSDAGDQGDGAGADAEVPHRPALHAALASRERCSGPHRLEARTGAAPHSIPRAAISFVRATRGVGVNRIGKNDGSDPLVAVSVFQSIRGGGRNASIDGCRSRRHRMRS